MTTSDKAGRVFGIAALALALGLGLLPFGGLCAEAPEPLRNRETTPAPTGGGDGVGGGGLVAPGGGNASGQGGAQATTVVVTPGGVVSPSESGGLVVPGQPGETGGKDGLSGPAGGLKPGEKGGVLPVVPLVPGGTGGAAKPGDMGGTVPVVPGKTGPADGKGGVPGAANASGVGGDQSTNVLVTPPVGVGPIVPGKTGLVPGKGEGATTLGKPEGGVAAGKTEPGSVLPIEVPADGKVFDASGRPVATPPGQEVALPNGGKVVDGQGATVAVPPGGRVLAPARPMTPGDFLPKVGKPANPDKVVTPGQVEPGKTPDGKPAKGEKGKTPDSKPGKGETDKAGKTPPAKPAPDNPPKEQSQAKPKVGDPFQIAEEACQKHTVGFLEGCWRSTIRLSDRTDVVIRFCFDASGKGKRIDSYKRDGHNCVTSTQAKWAQDSLSFSFGNFHCSDGTGGGDVPIICTGCGSGTKCKGTEYNNRTGKTTGKTNFEIARE